MRGRETQKEVKFRKKHTVTVKSITCDEFLPPIPKRNQEAIKMKDIKESSIVPFFGLRYSLLLLLMEMKNFDWNEAHVKYIQILHKTESYSLSKHYKLSLS